MENEIVIEPEAFSLNEERGQMLDYVDEQCAKLGAKKKTIETRLSEIKSLMFTEQNKLRKNESNGRTFQQWTNIKAKLESERTALVREKDGVEQKLAELRPRQRILNRKISLSSEAKNKKRDFYADMIRSFIEFRDELRGLRADLKAWIEKR